MEEPEPLPHVLTPCSSGRRRSGDSNSPEFEFWMVRNPSVPQPNLLSADELFSGGVVLPLHRLHLSDEPPQPSQEDPKASQWDRVPEPESLTNELADLSASSSLTSSKRWRDIFKKNDKKSLQAGSDVRSAKVKDCNVKEKKREKKNGGVAASNGVSAAELNINIWPFSRSRSAGNGGTRPRSTAAIRKVSSAPCSRSNSAGESKSRKWPSSPGRAGVHLGRSSPVWQVRRSSGGGRSSEAVVKSAEKSVKKDGNESRGKIPTAASGGSKAKVLSLNVPMCIGYRNHFSSRSDENSSSSVAAAAAGDCRNSGGVSREGVRGSNLFNIRSLFTKKVY